MMKSMIKATNTQNETVYFVVPEKNAQAMIELLDDMTSEYTTYTSANMPLEDLPEDIQKKVRETLTVFDSVNVSYEYGEFRVSANSCLRAHYHYDHFVCGYYKAKEVYTAEERKQHLAELNSYEMPEWAW